MDNCFPRDFHSIHPMLACYMTSFCVAQKLGMLKIQFLLIFWPKFVVRTNSHLCLYRV